MNSHTNARQLNKMKMMGTKIFPALLFCFIFDCTVPANSQSAGEQIIIRTTAAPNPVMKRLAANPLLRIGIYVPENKEASFRTIHCTLNPSAIPDIQKLELYFTDVEPLFSSTNLIATPTPKISFDIPVQLNLQPGWHYLWFSAVLKEQADIDHRISLQVRALSDASGKKQLVKQDVPGYTHPLGIALRKAGDDSVHTYRIPGLTTTNKGTIIAVYDIRYNNSGDLPGNIDVGMSRSEDGGKTWQPMKIIMDMGEPQANNGIGDPSILFDPVTKKIFVAALWSKGNRSIAGSEPGLSPDTTGQFVLVSSDDDGLTWSEPYNITAQVKNPLWHIYFQGPGNGIAMQDGTLVFPSQYWDESRKPGIPHASIIYSKDHGKTWTSGVGAKSNTTESQVVETAPGTLLLNMRDNRGSFRSVSTTKDLGKHWVEHISSYHALPDPVCMAGLISAKVKVKGVLKEVLFFSNCNSSSARLNTTVKASLDFGKTWLPAHQLLVDERRSYGYSTMTRIDDHTIGLLYEGTRDLYFMRIPVKDIIH
jgi:sialidase-1